MHLVLHHVFVYRQIVCMVYMHANGIISISILSSTMCQLRILQLRTLVEDLLRLEEGVCMYDVSKGADVLVLAPVMNIFCDNPLASELISHLGNSATKFCRVCLVKIWLISTYFVQL